MSHYLEVLRGSRPGTYYASVFHMNGGLTVTDYCGPVLDSKEAARQGAMAWANAKGIKPQPAPPPKCPEPHQW